MAKAKPLSRYVGVPRQQHQSSVPFGIKGKCALCSSSILITTAANFAREQLGADGYACFGCLEEHPELVAQSH